MLKCKKLFGVLLSVIIVLSVFTICFGATKPPNIEQISLVAENCNVYMSFSTNGKLEYDYDSSKFEMTTQIIDSTLNIGVKLKDGGKAELMDMITIYLPEQTYQSISVRSKSAGVTIPTVNSDISVVADRGAVSVTIPENFDRKVNYTATDSSGSIVFDESSKDYTLKMDIQNCSFKTGANMPTYKNGNKDYEYVNGNGNVEISVNIKNSSFTVRNDK